MQRNVKVIAGSAIVAVALGIGAGVAVAAGAETTTKPRSPARPSSKPVQQRSSTPAAVT